MNIVEKLGLKLLHKTDPENAHNLAIKALKYGMTPNRKVYTSKRLRQNIAGLDLLNPVGLAAGFDKNAEVIAPLLNTGFGFIEVGAATPFPQEGNIKPRLFRLNEDYGSINRFGFNNEGMEIIANRLSKRPAKGIVGLNLGANKNSSHRAIRRGIGGEYGRWFYMIFQGMKEVCFGLKVFHNGFDDQVTFRDSLKISGSVDSGLNCFRFIQAPAIFGYLPRSHFLQCGIASFQGFFLAVKQDHGASCLSGNLCNPRAHGSGAYNGDGFCRIGRWHSGVFFFRTAQRSAILFL